MTKITVSYGSGEKVPFEITNQETRIAIMNKLYNNGSMTVNQLSEELGIAQSAIHSHVMALYEYDLVKEVDAEDKRKSRVERYFALNFPVFSLNDLETIRKKLMTEGDINRMAEAFKNFLDKVKQSDVHFDFQRCGWDLSDPSIKEFLINDLWHAVQWKLTEERVLTNLKELDRKGKWRGFLWGNEYKDIPGFPVT